MSTLENVTDPNLVYNMRAKLDAAGPYDDFEVDRAVAVDMNPKAKQSELLSALEPVVDRLLKQYKAFAMARREARLPEDLVLYSARHTFGTEFRAATKDLKLTMKTMGQVDVKTAMRYQHPATDQVGDVINARNAQRKSATIGQDGHTFGHSDLPMQ